MFMTAFDRQTLIDMMDSAKARGNYFDVVANTKPGFGRYLFNVLNCNMHNFQDRYDEAVVLRRWLFKVAQIGVRDCEKIEWPLESVHLY